ncbi:MAG: spore cortex biosynthesis protein YabQ [Clostridia bacterium]|nr:spore cortex biosynthesis protein YabQ [Clostridia bacterium]
MDTGNQFSVFALCIAVGFCLGVLYEPFGFLRVVFGCRQGKNKTVAVTLDIAFCLLAAIVCVGAAYLFKFPSFRVYTWLGYAVGGIIYLKTLHKIIAFLENLCYNKITERIRKAKYKKKLLKKEGEKV